MRSAKHVTAFRFTAYDASGKVLLERQSDGDLTGSNIGAVVRGLLGGATGFKPAARVQVEAVPVTIAA